MDDDDDGEWRMVVIHSFCFMDRMKPIILQIVLASFGSSLLLRPNHDFAFKTRQVSKTIEVSMKQKFHEPTVLNMHQRQHQDEQETSSNGLFFGRRSFLDKVPHLVFSLGVMFVPSGGTFSQTLAMEDPLECRDGALMAESAVPGAYSQICMSLPERSITLKSTGDVIKVYQGSAPVANGDPENVSSTPLSDSNSNREVNVSGRTGVALWNSGILLTRLLDEINRMEPKYFEGKIVMELGCGTAVASITASKMGAKQIYATDGNQEVVQLAQANLKRNGINVDQSEGNHLGEATSLRWGLMDAVDYYDTADIIIGSDLTYNSGAWGLLAETFEAVLKPDGIAIYLSLGHSGFSISGELGGFATVIESQGRLEILSEGSEGWPFQKVTSLDSLLKNSLSNKELDVVKTTGGFKTLVLRKKRRRRSR